MNHFICSAVSHEPVRAVESPSDVPEGNLLLKAMIILTAHPADENNFALANICEYPMNSFICCSLRSDMPVTCRIRLVEFPLTHDSWTQDNGSFLDCLKSHPSLTGQHKTRPTERIVFSPFCCSFFISGSTLQ